MFFLQELEVIVEVMAVEMALKLQKALVVKVEAVEEPGPLLGRVGARARRAVAVAAGSMEMMILILVIIAVAAQAAQALLEVRVRAVAVVAEAAPAMAIQNMAFMVAAMLVRLVLEEHIVYLFGDYLWVQLVQLVQRVHQTGVAHRVVMLAVVVGAVAS